MKLKIQANSFKLKRILFLLSNSFIVPLKHISFGSIPATSANNLKMFNFPLKYQAVQTLENKVDVFTKDMTYQKATLGVDYDIVVEMHEDKEEFSGSITDLNLEFGVFPLIPVLPIPTVVPSISKVYNTQRTAVVQKLIYKSGILESTRVTDGTSVITTKNLIYELDVVAKSG